MHSGGHQGYEPGAHHLRQPEAEETGTFFAFSPAQKPHLLLGLSSVIGLREEDHRGRLTFLHWKSRGKIFFEVTDCFVDIVYVPPFLNLSVELCLLYLEGEIVEHQHKESQILSAVVRCTDQELE